MTGVGSIQTAVLIDTVSAEVAAPTAGSAFSLTAVSGDEEHYSASVAYYKDGMPVNSDSADYNTVYTAVVTLSAKKSVDKPMQSAIINT